MDVVSNKNIGSFNYIVISNWTTSFLESHKFSFPDIRTLFSCQVEQHQWFLSYHRLNSLLKLAREL